MINDMKNIDIIDINRVPWYNHDIGTGTNQAPISSGVKSTPYRSWSVKTNCSIASL